MPEPLHLRCSKVCHPSASKGLNQATGGNLPSDCGVRERRNKENINGEFDKRRPLNILQWYAEGVLKRKVCFTKKLYEDHIDIACTQETHLFFFSVHI
jgi:hypothetical protein